MTGTVIVRPFALTLRDALRLAAVFAASKMLLHFALTLWTTHIGYGYFRDEFYYIACGRHLAWGFVDHGPVVAVQARIGELLFGDSVFGMRVLSALAGAVMVFEGGLIAWAMDGRRPAQALAMLGLLCCPQFIGTDGFLSMNSCEAMYWMGCVLSLLFLQRGWSASIWWTVFGFSAGIGLLNKPSMAFFLVALGVGLLCTAQRQLLFTRRAGLGIVLLLLIAMPNVFWQTHHHWPTLEFLRNGRAGHKNAILPPVQFLFVQIMNMQPLNALLWITGVIALLRAKSIASMRWLGLTYLFFFAIMVAMHAKDYYLAGIYPAFFAAGAVAREKRFAASRAVSTNRVFAFPVFETLLIATTIIVLPLASPVLRPATCVRYTSALHLHRKEAETSSTGPLPQFFADRFGWLEMTDQVVRAYRALTPAEQRAVCIFANNYGEAGAINFLGPRQEPHLPEAISGQNNYWLWGPRGCTGQLMIAVIHDKPEQLQQRFASVQIVGRMNHPYSMPFEHRNIYLLRAKPGTAPLNWAEEKDYF